MRLGICAAIILKFLDVLPREILGSIHLFFIGTGLVLYHLRWRSTKGFQMTWWDVFFSRTASIEKRRRLQEAKSEVCGVVTHVLEARV